MKVFIFIMTDIIENPAFLVGLIVMLGLILQKKKFTQVLSGTVKTITGYVIFTCGSTIAVDVLGFLGPVIQAAFGIQAPVTADSGMGYIPFLTAWGGYATVAVAIAFIINLFLARFTPFKYVYLSGHLMIFGSLTIVCGLIATYPEINPVTVMLATGILLGIYCTLQPAYMSKYMNKVTGTTDLAYGHTSSLTCWIAASLGKLFGKKEGSSEDVKLPESLDMFKDTVVSLSLVLGIFTVIVALFAGPEVVGQYSGTSNYITYALTEGITFGAGISIILYGVRLIIGEIVPAFRGISKKLVPGAKPAMDCPIIFPYAPTAVIIGFLACFGAFLICMVFIGAMGWGIVVPSMIPIFFPGAAAGVFGNSTGGWKGAVLGGVITGVVLAFGQLIVANAMATSVPSVILSADPDTDILPMIAAGLGKLLKSLGL